ncbi:hypothetical protein Micbo1qcDRAFT_212811 [Microdochium bolleyi]|uniref:CENP-V/GFA domain-containing protein n=1 Tax=Microdochium bolleyi TaxID=196109 RepID=A0A136IWL5_9PEZI|nr:hypothetical protein Micbo1qcDRAFT_212811 [Microdochium bolleyi]
MTESPASPMPHSPHMRITCHCGAAAQTISLPTSTNADAPLEISICHCYTCRHVSGVLCTTYLEIAGPPASLSGLVGYSDRNLLPSEQGPEDSTASLASSNGETWRWFCRTCGSHVFARQNDSPGRGGVSWAVATGCLVGDEDGAVMQDNHNEQDQQGQDHTSDKKGMVLQHINIHDAKDGGLAPVLGATRSIEDGGGTDSSHDEQRPKPQRQHWATASSPSSLNQDGPRPQVSCTPVHGSKDAQFIFADSGNTIRSRDVLDLHCLCRRVSLVVTRPDESSTLPWSPHSDCVYPYHATPRDFLQNRTDEKWWIRPSLAEEEETATRTSKGCSLDTTTTDRRNKRYLAGTCTCRSCRLGCGFEIQTWAFVPRSNIFVVARQSGCGNHDRRVLFPLDFSSPPDGEDTQHGHGGQEKNGNSNENAQPAVNPTTAILKTYNSQEGVFREFCPTCGATVFWHNEERPGVIDVSAGLAGLCLPSEEFSVGDKDDSSTARGAADRQTLRPAGHSGSASAAARAVGWLDWWTERVSFFEHAAAGRTGTGAALGTKIAAELQEGLRAWGRERRGELR